MKLLMALRPNRFSYFQSTVFSGAMTYFFYWMYAELGLAMELPWPVLAFFLVCGVCAILFTLFFGYLFATAEPLLAVYEDGIQVSKAGLPSELIAWGDIKQIDFPGNGSADLRLHLKDPGLYQARQTSWLSHLGGLFKQKDPDEIIRLSLAGYMNQLEELKSLLTAKHKPI